MTGKRKIGRFPFRVSIPEDYLRRTVRNALREDLSEGDATTRLVVAPETRGSAVVRLKDDGVVAGLRVFRAVFKEFDPATRVTSRVKEGARCKRGTVLARVTGRSRSILACERVALNFLQRLSGTATATRILVDRVSGTGVKILDTRKTTPGLRPLEKYAVALGGGFNHRPSLADLALVKDNHIRAAGGLREALRRLGRTKHGLLIEVEVAPDVDLESLKDLDVDILMFDNWPRERLSEAIARVRLFPARPLVEVSGGIRPENVRALALTRPDFISVGYITHSAPSLDISLDFEDRPA